MTTDQAARPWTRAVPFFEESEMDDSLHSMTNLFSQLGLPATPADIQAFIESHRSLAAHQVLHEAPFWTSSQAEFLREQVQEDADWAGVIDRLDSGLRQPGP
jgi:hypothetical protein